MDELIRSLTQKLGIDESLAQGAVGKLLGFLQEKLDKDTFSALAKKLPGADKLVGAAADSGAPAGGGLFGGLAKMAASVVGGQAGEGLEAAALVKSLGLDGDKATSLVATFVNFIKDKAGKEVLDKLAAQIPALKQWLPG